MKLLRSLVNVLALVTAAMGLALLVGLTVVPTALGYRSYVVLSGSMAPTIPIGSVVMAASVAPSTLKVGDVVVYNRSDVNERVTHRIVEVRNDSPKPMFVTKGDANSAPDVWTVQYSDTAGKVIFSLPYVGYVNFLLESPQGRTLFVVIPVTVLAVMWLWQIWRPSAKGQPQPAPASTPVDIPASATTSLPVAGVDPSASGQSTSLPLRH